MIKKAEQPGQVDEPVVLPQPDYWAFNYSTHPVFQQPHVTFILLAQASGKGCTHKHQESQQLNAKVNIVSSLFPFLLFISLHNIYKVHYHQLLHPDHTYELTRNCANKMDSPVSDHSYPLYIIEAHQWYSIHSKSNECHEGHRLEQDLNDTVDCS